MYCTVLEAARIAFGTPLLISILLFADDLKGDESVDVEQGDGMESANVEDIVELLLIVDNDGRRAALSSADGTMSVGPTLPSTVRTMTQSSPLALSDCRREGASWQVAMMSTRHACIGLATEPFNCSDVGPARAATFSDDVTSFATVAADTLLAIGCATSAQHLLIAPITASSISTVHCRHGLQPAKRFSAASFEA